MGLMEVLKSERGAVGRRGEGDKKANILLTPHTLTVSLFLLTL